MYDSFLQSLHRVAQRYTPKNIPLMPSDRRFLALFSLFVSAGIYLGVTLYNKALYESFYHFQSHSEQQVLSSSQANVAATTSAMITFPSPTIAPSPAQTPQLISNYPWHHDIVATVFWVGEGASQDNSYIANYQSAWNSDWVGVYGGIDDPDERDGWYPASFVPLENPFYVALPYSDFDPTGKKENARQVPWYFEGIPQGVSVVKNRWIEVQNDGTSCFGQWENTGPYESDDMEYVFGTAAPRNTNGLGAGIDLSPALRDCLAMESVANVSWRFIEEADVPEGPWKAIVTTSNPQW